MARITSIVNENINFSNISTWLDIGTGDGKVVSELKWNNLYVHKIYTDIKPIQSELLKDWTFLLYEDLRNYLSMQDTNSISLITLFDVIEHFKKEEALDLLKEI